MESKAFKVMQLVENEEIFYSNTYLRNNFKKKPKPKINTLNL